jgi:DNA (cytosine-5)-methyltransferase 1
MNADKPIISLFSGAMGLDLGLESAGSGLRTSVALELNSFAVETIKLNRPKLPVVNRPIQKVKTDEILMQAGLKVGDAFLVTGGPCCQSFSTAGKRASLGDQDRGGLPRIAAIVRDRTSGTLRNLPAGNFSLSFFSKLLVDLSRSFQ